MPVFIPKELEREEEENNEEIGIEKRTPRYLPRETCAV